MSPAVFAGLTLAAGLGAFVQGTVGLGFALIVAPVAIWLAPDLVPVTVLCLMLPLNLYVIGREHGAVDRAGAGWVTVGRVVGTALGMGVLLLLTLPALRLVIGLSTIGAVVATWLAPAFRPNRGAFLAAGLVTGVTETATGVGGPPLALVFQHASGPTLRTTVATCFTVGQILSLAALLAVGRVTAEHLRAVALLLPAVGLGALASHLSHRALDGRRLRRAVLAFALVSGLALLV